MGWEGGKQEFSIWDHILQRCFNILQSQGHILAYPQTSFNKIVPDAWDIAGSKDTPLREELI